MTNSWLFSRQRKAAAQRISVGCTKFNTPTQAYALSNVATNRTLDANTIFAADLADVVGTLINDLRDRLLVRF